MADQTNSKLDIDPDGIAWLSLDVPGSSANTLGRAVTTELQAVIAQLAAKPPKGLVIRSAKASGFIAGANIHEFTAFKNSADALATIQVGQRLMDAIEALPCPTVAAIHGFAMGGGLELALACTYRVAVGDGKLALALPEVQLGIHPGFGGTVRSVRLLGVRAAMELMLTGKSVRAPRALGLGLVDRLVDTPDQLATAARELINTRPAPHRPALLERAMSWPMVRPWIAKALLNQVQAKAPREHYPAPYAMVELWKKYGASGRAAYDAEARSIAQLFESSTARALVRVYLLTERLKSLAKGGGEVQKVHVVGAGVMGGDIAAWCALRGLEVTLQDRELKYIEPALGRAQKLFEKRISDATQRAAASARLKADVAGEGVAGADLLIEAIFEDLGAKQALYAAAEPKLKPDATLASNTSSLTIETLSAKLADPARMVGLHFFNPVAQMPLVEVIHTDATSPQHLSKAMAFTRRIDKLPLPCRSGPGFLVNRVLFPYLDEALFAAGEGVPLADIDRAAEEFGMPMGPIELADVVGLDVMLHVGEIVNQGLGRDSPPYLSRVRELVAARQLGRKSGQGFYKWVDGKCEKPTAAGTPPAEFADRLILPMINECVACLRDGIVADEDLVDAGVVFGTGFAPFRGGPLHYARERGLPQILAKLRDFAQLHGRRFEPDAGWERLL